MVIFNFSYRVSFVFKDIFSRQYLILQLGIALVDTEFYNRQLWSFLRLTSGLVHVSNLVNVSVGVNSLKYFEKKNFNYKVKITIVDTIKTEPITLVL